MSTYAVTMKQASIATDVNFSSHHLQVLTNTNTHPKSVKKKKCVSLQYLYCFLIG